MPDQQGGGSKAMPFIISLASHLFVMWFGATDTVLNPIYAEPIWNMAIQLPYIGTYINQYLNATLLLGILSFIFVWLVAMAALGWLGKIFGGAAPLVMVAIGVFIGAVVFGVNIMGVIQNLKLP